MASKLAQFFNHDRARLQLYQRFTEHYQQDPMQMSAEEIAEHYGALANILDDQEMDSAHQQAFVLLSDEDRRELAQQYQYASRDPTRAFQGYRGGTHFAQMMEPRWLGRMTRYAAQHDPELVAELIGTTTPLKNSSMRLALAGTTVALVRPYLSKE
jgi:hypothetical protein